MELYIDLLKRETKKSLFRIALGILFFLLAIVWISIRFFDNETIKPFDWISFGLFAIIGIIHIVEGLGFPFEKIFGKAYVLINSEFISLKASVFEKEQFVKWNDIISIDYKLNKLKIEKIDNTTLLIDLTKFNYITINEIKKAVSCIAKVKNIEANNFPV